MDYLILTAKFRIRTTSGEVEQVQYLCVNGISRCKSAEGKDVLQYVISGYGQQIPVEDVLCITPATPTQEQYATFKK